MKESVTDGTGLAKLVKANTCKNERDVDGERKKQVSKWCRTSWKSRSIPVRPKVRGRARRRAS